MQELFEDISEKTRKDCTAIFSIVARTEDILKGVKILESFRTTLNAREQEYMDFAFHAWMEEHNIHESIAN